MARSKPSLSEPNVADIWAGPPFESHRSSTQNPESVRIPGEASTSGTINGLEPPPLQGNHATRGGSLKYDPHMLVPGETQYKPLFWKIQTLQPLDGVGLIPTATTSSAVDSGGLGEGGITPTSQSAGHFRPFAQHSLMCPAAFPVQRDSPLFVGGVIVNGQRLVVREKLGNGKRGKDKPSVTGLKRPRKSAGAWTASGTAVKKVQPIVQERATEQNAQKW
eukprot:CAMPEP_0185770984 /NCGR_PEP_ID=MMETSP1174-20130828/62495_1 /TAXON_ID=35687 /ORGANISM="Dictyocha speculum, Strain CCMP1381" /LENGTH=219 /DNA_ID=CAMNT_0028456673 /DNA_START=64 /DNA_END=724 /DNA_ORIENTATION=-